MMTNRTPSETIAAGQDAITEYFEAMRVFRSRRKHLLAAARGLLAARRLHPSSIKFGHWLRTSPYRGLNETDRAALLHIARHEREVARFLKTHPTLSAPNFIWCEAKRAGALDTKR